MAELAVKLDLAAILRDAAGGGAPEPVAVALLAELAGAESIALGLGQASGGIQDRDVRLLKKILQSRLILELPPTSEMIGLALDIKPDAVTLVPPAQDRPGPAAGLDLVVYRDAAAETVATLKNAGIRVGVSIDPSLDQVKLAHRIDVDRIQIFTGQPGPHFPSPIASGPPPAIVDAVKLASKLKKTVSVGGSLTCATIRRFSGLGEIDLFVVGRAIIAKSIMVGMERAVREMVDLVRGL